MTRKRASSVSSTKRNINETSAVDRGELVGSATVRAPGVCGELVQGVQDGIYFLVTCPVDFFARVRVDLYRNGASPDAPNIEVTEGCPKSVEALLATLEYLERVGLAARINVGNPIPRSKGMGSSSADVAATIAATGLALGVELTSEAVARIALSVEPTDGIMFPGVALFDHREGRRSETLGPPPPMEIIALDFGGVVDTVEFNKVDRRPIWESVQAETSEALELVRSGVRKGDPALVGQGSTISAVASQQILAKLHLAEVQDFAKNVGAVGVNVGHSGTIIGVLLDARQRRGKSTFRQAREAFPEAETVHHFRLMGGGLQSIRA